MAVEIFWIFVHDRPKKQEPKPQKSRKLFSNISSTELGYGINAFHFNWIIDHRKHEKSHRFH